MTQDQLDRAIARRTGESMASIRRQGFCLLPVPTVCVRPRRSSVNKPVKLRTAS